MAKVTSPFSDKICYFLNSGAVGDMTAASAVINYAIKTFHEPRKVNFKVALFPEFKELFPQVPEENLISLEEGLKLEGYAIRKLNMDRPQNSKSVAILTPSRFHLIHYASVGLLARIVDIKQTPYVSLNPVNVDHFGIDFDKAVVMVVTYRDITRRWPGEEINKTALAIQEMGLTPVYIGKTGAMANWKNVLAKTEFEYPGFGIDLTNKTSIPEMASIMGKSRAVLGMDSGPVHVAMTTNVPVICGFTNVNPELRIPNRENSITIPVIADELICRFCQSDWNLDFWNFQKCPVKSENPECVNHMKAEKFILAVKKVCGK
jgi:Glycosyltransferase family 9 (heptosyltransferase)